MKYIDKDGVIKECAEEYSMVATIRGQEVVCYESFGDYQGEWVLVSKDATNYYIYRGGFGSCSGCDSLQAEFIDSWDTIYEWEKIKDFIDDYKEFVTIPKEQFEELYKSKQLLSIFPANFRDEYSDIKLDEVVEAIKI